MFKADTHIAEAGRAVFASELAKVHGYQAALLQDADEIAIHETRKAIRRTLTAFKLFAPYFEPETFQAYRRGLKKLMRRLGRSRDVAVFLDKLAAYAEVYGALPALADYWWDQKIRQDEELRDYARGPKMTQLLDDFERFVESPGQGVRHEPDRPVPNKVKHLVPLLIHERVAAVRAYEDLLAGVTVEQMHQLRIQFKELRYALNFFAPLMSAQIEPVEATLEVLQDALGDLNDARVALRMLAVSPVEKDMIVTYHQAKEMEISQLIAEFPLLWSQFNAPKWRGKLAASMAVL